MTQNNLYLLAALAVILLAGYAFYFSTQDKKAGKRFFKAFSEYDINQIDACLSENTEIVFEGKRKPYAKLREHVIAACREQMYPFFYDGSNVKIKKGISGIEILSYKKRNRANRDKNIVTLVVKKQGLLKQRVVSVISDNPVFGYVFFGNK